MEYTINAATAPPPLAWDLRLGGTNPQGDRLGLNDYFLEWNGKAYFAISGEFHFSRYPYRDWEEEIVKMKLAGIDIIPTYLFWIHHEEEEGRFDWSGNNNLRYFVDLCAKHGVWVILRIGPFAHGECRNGGFPDWLYGRPFAVRSNDEGYLYYVRRFYQAVGRQVRGQLFKDGGPVIGVQLENEYMASSAKWEFTTLQGDEWIPKGSGGAAHMLILKGLAREAGLDVPLYTCTGWGNAPVPAGEVLPMWGGYAFQPWLQYWNPENAAAHPPTGNYLFRDYHRNQPPCLDASYPTERYPYACCEMGGGMQTWYTSRFIVPPQSVEAMTVNRVAGGCNFIGYYMFHGGSNPVGRHTYFNERCVPKIGYDFQAPLGEFGQVRESYRCLKPLHYFCRDFAALLCPMVTRLPDNAAGMVPADVASLRYAVRSDGASGFLFLTNYQDHVALQDHKNLRITVRFGGEELIVPAGGGFDLKQDVSAILPLNLDMDGIRVKYATAQPVTRLEVNGEPYYFFFVPEGMTGEYCLDAANLTGIAVTEGWVSETEQRAVIKVKPGTNCWIKLATGRGKTVFICTLTRQQILSFWKAELWGCERVILTPHDVLTGPGYLELRNRQCPDFEFLVFPDVEGALQNGGRILDRSQAGVFGRYSFAAAQHSVSWEWQTAGPAKATIRLPQEDFSSCNELFLRVAYRGDIGCAFWNGQLMHDHFYNGEIWEIGLKRFYPEVAGREIVLSILPLRQGRTVVSDAGLAVTADFVGEEMAAIDGIEILPEYKAKVVKV